MKAIVINLGLRLVIQVAFGRYRRIRFAFWL